MDFIMRTNSTFLKKTNIAISLILCAFQSISYAAECSAKSGINTVPLLELYTSEGCSSCPPADKWLSAQQNDATKFIPLAFHVDYWDTLGGKYGGWKDEFSKAEYSERQRRIASFNKTGFVYTPQFVMNGRDFKGWDNARLKEQVQSSQKIASRANLSLNSSATANGEILLKVTAEAVKPSDAKNVDIFVAIYENKLSSIVKAGENNGRELKHDYVVRDLFGAYQLSNVNTFNKDFTLKSLAINTGKQFENMGAVVFVQSSQTGEILQSLALKFGCN